MTGPTVGRWVTRRFELEGTSLANRWCADALDRSLAALEPIARPRSIRVVFGEAATEPLQHLTFERSGPAEQVSSFIQRAVERIRSVQPPLREASAELDIRAWIHESENAGPAARRWLPSAADLVLKPQAEDDGAYAYLELHTSLFSPVSSTGDAIPGLHNQNQPALEAALRRWEAALGRIEIVEGIGIGLYRYGFWTSDLAFLARVAVPTAERDINQAHTASAWRDAMVEAVEEGRAYVSAHVDAPTTISVTVEIRTRLKTWSDDFARLIMGWIADGLTDSEGWDLVQTVDVIGVPGPFPLLRLRVVDRTLVQDPG